MSGCGCNQESSCEDTKQKQNESKTDSCKIKDLATEESKSSCCDNEVQQELTPDEKDSCGSKQSNSCCGPDTINLPEQVRGNESIVAFISDYNIPKMDCSAEEQMVRMTLSSLV
ncbi:cation transporter, partial [Acinetobacter sp. ANC5681]|nr:cation transporter [Acinetobacter sp. ANC5681]